ncbi:hypothetical protein CWI38_0072p0030 [Hamiltosporidium tvaerminnensis]|uniref:Uncharacterized protein n=1 Tax=Hamiltosporidium tvaerminnensis TaxID=1176355 RepID=A0A4Q9M2M0_9MICR|nr:hypothetical protein CWI38_0072p0030 [Hamiltosporidium tvaerminnensis]
MKENSKLNTAGNNEVVSCSAISRIKLYCGNQKKIEDHSATRLRINSQDSLQIVETERLRKYDLLANELGLIYKCTVEIIAYVMTWDGVVTKYHKSHLKRLEIPMNVEAYIQYIVLKKTVETISFDRRRGLESGQNAEESCDRASLGVIE